MCINLGHVTRRAALVSCFKYDMFDNRDIKSLGELVDFREVNGGNRAEGF